MTVFEIGLLIDNFDYNGSDTPGGYLKTEQEKTDDTFIKKLIQVEIDCLNFILSNGQIHSMYSTTDQSGVSIFEYPSLKDFDAESLAYLVKRLASTTNERMKARYGQILWNSNQNGKGEYVKSSVDAYFGIIAQESDHFYFDVNNLLYMSISSKYRTDEIKSFIVKRIRETSLPYNDFTFFVPKVLEFRKQFTREQIQEIISKSESIWSAASEMSLYIYESIATIAIKLLKVQKKDSKIWFARLAEFYEKSIGLRTDDTSGMMSIEYCERAILNYKLGGRADKANELLKQLTRLKANLKLDTYKVEFSSKELTRLYRYQEDSANKLTDRDPDYIMDYLVNAPNIFPDVEFLKKTIEARAKSFEDFANVIRYDINKNPSHKKKGNSFKEDLMREYDQYVQIVAIHFLKEVFKSGLQKQKLTFKTMVENLYANSWLGKNIRYRNSGGDPYEHNWLAMIAPSLLDFFVHWQALHQSANKFQNFILCIDSLTLKFEGILRDFGRIVGANTLTHVKGNLREAYIEELLANEDIRKHINQDDLMLFKFLFTSSGRNIRNNVAHAFYKFHHYKPDMMILLIMAILRISKYQVNLDKIEL